MASCRRRKSGSNPRRDVISELPSEVKERILECLPTREVARTAVLSTRWRDVWLRHGRLAFDWDFFQGLKNGVAAVKIITNILLHRARPVKKFTLQLTSRSNPKLQQSDLDQWFLYLSRNGVEELDISLFVPNHKYNLPSCILSCQTMKVLKLENFHFECPANVRALFPGVTSLAFNHVDFKSNGNGIVHSIPNLEKLAFYFCTRISDFEFSALKLESLSAICCVVEDASIWLKLHFKAIKTLCLYPNLLSHANAVIAAPMFPIAINLQVIKLYFLSFTHTEQLSFALQLLQKSPNLCQLEILASNKDKCSSNVKKAASRLLEDPASCIITQDMKMLNTIKIEDFSGSTVEMLFVKMLLSKSPALERVVIREYNDMDSSVAVKILRELVLFPRASPKAQIVFMEYGHSFSQVGFRLLGI